jgi:hypothetical protein
MSQVANTTLGELIALAYEEYMDLYQDEDLAAVAASTVVSEMLASGTAGDRAEAA